MKGIEITKEELEKWVGLPAFKCPKCEEVFVLKEGFLFNPKLTCKCLAVWVFNTVSRTWETEE